MKKLLSYLRPYRASVAFALVLVFVQSISELLLPALMAEIVDRGVVRGDTGLILRSGVLMLFVALAGAACNILSAFYSSKVSMAFGRDLRLELFSRVESFSAREFDAIGVSTLITRTTNDVSQIQNFLIMALRLLARAPLMAIGGLIMALYTDARLSLVLVVALPLLAASVALVSAKGMPLFRRMQDRIDALNLVLREGLTGIRVVRAFNRLETERVRFRAANEELRRTSLSAQRIMTVLMPVMMILMNLTTVAVVWFGGLRVDAGAIQVGDLMAFVQYAMQILFSMMMLSAMFAMYPRASISADRVAEVLETSSSIRDPERAPASAEPLPERSGRIEFRNVSFRYPGAEEYALRDVSFSVAAGETTAIIGGTGSGKTTLVSLLLRFYDAESGSVQVDGRDVREFRQEELRARMGYAPQKAHLFSGTVADNIRFGAPDAGMDEVRSAAEAAQARDFISELPLGYETAVAQGGTNFSGGQRQRISIARVLARRPEICVFDDSFSALDFTTDARLRAALAERPADAAVLIVAQRIATIRNADRIVVLDEGKVAGIGTHGSLLADCPVYREIASSQLSTEESA